MGSHDQREAIEQLMSALAEVGLEAADDLTADPGADLVVRGRHGVEFAIEVKHRALVRDSDVPTLTSAPAATDRRTGVVDVVVADRITGQAKDDLRAKAWGWLDLRGDLHLEGPGVFIDARVSPAERVAQVAREPLVGTVGLQLASLLLMDPHRTYGVREAATEIARAPSSVSQEFARLREAGLVNSRRLPVLPDLFRALARRWRPESIDVASLPESGTERPRDPMSAALRLGFADPEREPGWALSDTLAAIAYGAPLNTSGAYPPEFYVPDRAAMRRARQLLGGTTAREDRAATLRGIPVPLITSRRVEWDTEWPLAHPLFVALDLAQDPDRGSEALAAWDPPRRWQRVW